jgi:predicted O-linked N-acetylglucosamine transferase (SPINDLY family)
MPLNIVNVENSFSHGIQMHTQGRYIEAEQYYRQVLAFNPRHAGALQNLGVLAFQVGNNQAAIQLLSKAAEILPNQPGIYCNLADVYAALRDADKALTAYQTAIRLDPELATAYNNMGIVYSRMGRVADAIAAWEKAYALAQKPSAHGRILVGLGGGGTSINQNEGTLLAAAAANNLGNAYLQQLELEKAIEYHRRACELNPGYPNAHSNLLRDYNHIDGLTPEFLKEEHRKWWGCHARGLTLFAHKNTRDPDRKLRLGFVSPDFREHSVTHFLLPLFENIDRNAFELVCYSGVQRPDEFTEMLSKCTAGWRNSLTLRDHDLAALINKDGIDILFDLSGHTSDNRLPVFGYKPAPLQVSYLGYPMTSGAPIIDYRIADPIVDPPGVTDSHYVEKLLRLPRGMWCYRPPLNIPCEEAPPVVRDPTRPFTFGSFNNASKMSAATFRLWGNVLKAVPGSRLLIKASAMNDAGTREIVLSRFEKQGISRDRIVSTVQQHNLADHFAYYANVDVALDTVPYNGTTTTCESLWMNVPVLALAGTMHIGRVGASLLTNAGLPQLVAQTEDEFVRLAARYATDIPALVELRRGLRERLRTSPLMDGPAFARDFAAALRGIWREWCASGS